MPAPGIVKGAYLIHSPTGNGNLSKIIMQLVSQTPLAQLFNDPGKI